jgi:hypothetical protein
MRRLFFAAVLGLVALVPAGVAAATPQQLHSQVDGQPVPAKAAARESLQSRAPRFVPLARTLTGTGIIDLNVYTYLSQPEVAATVGWWVYTATDSGQGDGVTDVNGNVRLENVPGAPQGNGEVFVYTADGRLYDIWNWGWPDTGFTGAIQPGQMDMSITRSTDGNWNYWDSAEVYLGATEASYNAGGDAILPGSGQVVTGGAPTVSTGPATLDWGTINYWMNEGAELPVSGVAIAPGQPAGTVNVNEADAHGIWFNGWGSGKPGTTTSLVFERFPEGWVNSIGGVATYPDTAPWKTFADWTAGKAPDTGPNYQPRRFTIPATTPAGYAYYVFVGHVGGSLQLRTWYQTCTCNASRTTIRPGQGVRISGVVPTAGHMGSQAGQPKTVTLYKRTRSAGQPTAWDATKRGWTRVRNLTANGYGRYSSPLLHPKRTTWYIVRYEGDDWYWGAYTGVRKVTVR